MEKGYDSLEKLLSEVIEPFIVRLSEGLINAVQEMAKAFDNLEDLIELGKKNWVVSFPIDKYIVDMDQDTIDAYFCDLIETDQELYCGIKNTILKTSALESKFVLLSDIFQSFEAGNYSVACISLSTMMEYLLAIETNFNSTKMSYLVQGFKDTTGKIPIDENGIIGLFGLDGFLNNYVQSTNGFEREKEPKYINRHWIAHGRMYRTLTKVDAYQMLCAIYAYVNAIETKERIIQETEVVV